MSEKDISARFEGSYTLYKDIPVWVYKLTLVDDDFIIKYIPVLELTKYTNTSASNIPFIQEQVNRTSFSTDRPNSGYYLAGNLPAYLYYIPKRQYSRGLVVAFSNSGGGENTVLYCPNSFGRIESYKLIHAVLDNKTKSLHRIDYEELCYRTTVHKETIVLRNHFCYYPREGYTEIYYKTKSVATLDSSNLHVGVHALREDIKECFLNLPDRYIK